MEPSRSANETIGPARTKTRLDPDGLALLRAALEQEIGNYDVSSSPGLRDALQHICDDAKRNSVPPELLLIALKAELHTLPSVRRLTPGRDREECVARLVSLCITEFYRAPQR
jgi:hypothetical protein